MVLTKTKNDSCRGACVLIMVSIVGNRRDDLRNRMLWYGQFRR